MAPPQSTNLPKLVTSLTTINPLETIGHNETKKQKELDQDVFQKKQTSILKSVHICRLVLSVVLEKKT